MLLKRFYDDKLAQASWMVGCAATGEALVIDANRDVEPYVRAAAAEGLRITHVTETHIHADFVSGSRELAERTGARLFLSDEGDASWKYAFAADAGATLLRDGDRFMVGNVAVEVLHTPGHTPEHLSFMITDTAAASVPMGVFTGDFVFAGDVGRPDLLERAAKVAGTMESSARTLHRSLQRFKQLPDWLQLWPGHGAGSACGKALGAVPSTTLGYERRTNWGLAEMTEDDFVARVLAGQPEPPRYFAEMKRINKLGPRSWRGGHVTEQLPAPRIAALLADGATVVDTRPASQYGAGHLPGTLNIPLDRAFPTWAGWLVGYERPFYLIVDDTAGGRLADATRDLAMIGLDRVSGWFDAASVQEWGATSRALAVTSQISAAQLAERMRDTSITVVDVRGAAEWEAGHLPGALHVPLGYLTERLQELPADEPLVVQCQGGARSAIAASVLAAHGRTDVLDLRGGLAAWRAAGLPVEQQAMRVPTPGLA